MSEFTERDVAALRKLSEQRATFGHGDYGSPDLYLRVDGWPGLKDLANRIEADIAGDPASLMSRSGMIASITKNLQAGDLDELWGLLHGIHGNLLAHKAGAEMTGDPIQSSIDLATKGKEILVRILGEEP